MKAALVAIVLGTFSLATLAAPAYAQMGGGGMGGGGGGGRHKGSDTTQPGSADKQKKMAAEEKAAKAAMDKVPDSKEKYDPWKIGH